MDNKIIQHSYSYTLCNRMIESVFRENRIKFLDKQIKKISNLDLPMMKENIPQPYLVKAKPNLTRRIPSGSGYCAAKFLR